MKLNFAIICDNAFVDKSNRLSIIQTFEEIYANKFPAIQTRLTVVSNYKKESESEEEEISSLKNITRIKDPKGNKIAEVVVEAPLAQGNNQFISYFNGIPIAQEGIYLIEIYLNNELKTTLQLHVMPSIKRSASTN